MSNLDEILELYAYNRWANARVLDAVSVLSDEDFTRDLGNSFPSIRDTLVHMLGAEWIWLSRWKGIAPSGLPDGWATSGYDELRRLWAAFEEDQQAFLSGLTDAALLDVYSYSTMNGDKYRTPLRQMLRHVVNHATYHRGQVTTMLRQLGAKPASTDLISFYRSLKG